MVEKHLQAQLVWLPPFRKELYQVAFPFHVQTNVHVIYYQPGLIYTAQYYIPNMYPPVN